MANEPFVPISISEALAGLTFFPNRTPATTDEEARGAFAQMAGYRDGGIFVGHWAGNSEWERHPVGDEIVMVVEGETTLFMLDEEGEHPIRLRGREFVVVPQGVWHRFETPHEVKVLTVTPQPTDHRQERPQAV